MDIFTYQDSHAPISEKVSNLVKNLEITPVLILQATAYPQGRMQSVLLKGIDTKQQIIKLPTSILVDENGEINAIIGKKMSKNLKLKEGENILIRWRDKNGTFDATSSTKICLNN